MSTVFVVLHENYGDQGVDFHFAFATRELADQYVRKREPRERERTWWEVREVVIQGASDG